MNIIFQVNGGIGKNVMATAVCEGIKKKYPKSNLIVITGYPEVYLNNPNVYRCFNFSGMPYFYDEYIRNKEVILMAHDPYMETDYIKQDKHLIEIWFNLFGLKYKGEMPKVFLTANEQKFFSNQYLSDKPLFVIQPNGGLQTGQLYSWARDIPSHIVIEVIKEFKNDYHIVHVKREDQAAYEDTTPVTSSFRSLVVLLSKSEKRLLIDSFAQHTAMAIGMKSTVLWIANKPSVFGYEANDNIVSNPFTTKPELRNSMLSEFNHLGAIEEFPYNSENEIFDVKKVIASLKAQ